MPPGKYSLRGNAPAGTGGPGVGRGGALAAGGSGNWILRSSVAGGRDTLDFPLEIQPNMNIADAIVTFADSTTELTGVMQDSQGAATSDYSIIVFPTDSQFWVPQSRRIQSVRPGTDGRYTVRNLPPGQYAIAAVTDVERDVLWADRRAYEATEGEPTMANIDVRRNEEGQIATPTATREICEPRHHGHAPDSTVFLRYVAESDSPMVGSTRVARRNRG